MGHTGAFELGRSRVGIACRIWYREPLYHVSPQMGALTALASVAFSFWLSSKIAKSNDSIWSRLAFTVCAFPIFYGLTLVLLSAPSCFKGTGAVPFLVLMLLMFVSAPVGIVLLLIHRFVRRNENDSRSKSGA